MSDAPSPLETAINIVRQKDYPPASRLNAILYMVEKYQPECQPVLEEILSDRDEPSDVRSAAALALGKVGGDRALELLKEMANSKDTTVKSYTMQALGMTGREEAVPILLDGLHDEDNTIFASAAEALGRIGDPVGPHLVKLLTSNDAEDARCVAAWQLGSIRFQEAVPSLVQVIRRDKNPELLALSIWALGEIGEQANEVMEILEWAKEQKDPAIHERAERALKKIARHLN